MSIDKRNLGTIELFTHGVRIKAKDDRVKVACRRLLNEWCVYEERKVENYRGDLVVERYVSQMYGVAFKNQNDFWIHKGQLQEFKRELQCIGATLEDFEIKTIPVHIPAKISVKLKEGRVLREYQDDAKRFTLAPVPDGDHFSKMIGMPVGSGKGHPNDTPILTPSGWVPMGDLRVGDEVISVDGKPTKIIGVYPLGKKDVYKVRFADGRSTYVTDEHLWRVHNYDWRGSGWRTKNTLEVKSYIETKKSKVQIPLYRPQEGEDIDLPIHPYLFGALLGDGSWTNKSGISFAKPDDFFEEVFDKYLPKGNSWRRRVDKVWLFSKNDIGRANPETTLNQKLDDLGVIGTRSWEKSIPEIYMKGSLTQRMELIRGLMDTDGTSDVSHASFCTTSEKLAMQFIELIRSIGGIARYSTKIPRYTYNGEKKLGRKAWIIGIRVKKPNDLFHLPRKKERLKDFNQYSEKLALTVESVNFDGYEECTCIAVEHPSHLYVCNDYIVTHNTVTFCATTSENAERTVIGVLPIYRKKWLDDLEINLDIKPKDIMLIEKVTQLRGVVDKCKTEGHKWLPSYIIVTLTTLQALYDKFAESPEDCVEDIGCEPWELMGLLGAGMFGIDEAHQHLLKVFLTAMYLHGVKFMALSGTMRTEDPFEEKIQNTIFPQIKRYLDVKMKKYIDVEFIGYTFHPSILRAIRYQAFGRKDYSHAIFEQSIMKIPAALNDYLNMNVELLNYDYIPRKEGKKALVFAGTVEMANKLVEKFKRVYPTLNIARYCAAQNDKYEDLLTADLTVSTIQSSGTAVDIPNLITSICNTMVNSSKSNIQVLGRLRELPNGEKVKMIMPYCKQNPKHLKYTQFRYELFKDITKSIKSFNYDSFIGAK